MKAPLPVWQQREEDLRAQLQPEQLLAQPRVLPGHSRQRLAATYRLHRNRFLQPRPRMHRNSRLPGGAYIAQWMTDAAVKNIEKKIAKYQNADIRSKYALHEFDLLCFYCDEAMLHNTPIHSVGYGFPQLAEQVRQNLRTAPRVFDRIFLFHPYEDPKAIRVF